MLLMPIALNIILSQSKTLRARLLQEQRFHPTEITWRGSRRLWNVDKIVGMSVQGVTRAPAVAPAPTCSYYLPFFSVPLHVIYYSCRWALRPVCDDLCDDINTITPTPHRRSPITPCRRALSCTYIRSPELLPRLAAPEHDFSPQGQTLGLCPLQDVEMAPSGSERARRTVRGTAVEPCSHQNVEMSPFGSYLVDL